jgi:hypothetical protein
MWRHRCTHLYVLWRKNNGKEKQQFSDRWRLTSFTKVSLILQGWIDIYRRSLPLASEDGFNFFFNFSIVNFPYLCGNIPISPANGFYISQLIRYARACSTYDQFLNWGSALTNKLMSQGFLQPRLQAPFRKYYGRYNDLVCQYNLPVGQKLSDVFHANR